MRLILFALGLAAALSAPAAAQYPAGPTSQSSLALIAPTPASPTDSSNRIATTAWVNSLIANGLTLASGKIWIGSAGNIATPQTPSGDCTLALSGVITCTQAAGNFQVIGNLTVGGSIIDGSGILATNIAAPATPAAGTTRIYVDSTQKILSAKNDAGTISNTVVPSTAVANQFMTGISAAGVISRAQPAFSDLSGQGTCAQEPALTGNVTSSAGSCATTIGANQVARSMEAQGIARSVIGVTGNATANVADIQGTANQFLGINSAGTALAFATMSQDCTLATGVITCTKTNNVSFAASATTDTTVATNISSGTLPAARLPLTSATLQAAPANPSNTVSSTGVMMGLGVATCRIAMVYSTRMRFEVNGTVLNNGAGAGSTISLRFGTGAGPANGTALSGTTIGPTVVGTSATASAQIPFSISGLVTGLAAGTTYWFDVSLAASGTTSAMTGIGCNAMEF